MDIFDKLPFWDGRRNPLMACFRGGASTHLEAEGAAFSGKRGNVVVGGSYWSEPQAEP